MAEMTNKVVGIGFHKTGTSTLNVCYNEFGYVVGGIQKSLAADLIAGNIEPAMKVADGCTAFRDNPWPLLYKEFDKRYDNCRFILTLRDEEKWIKSLLNHCGDKHTDMREWIYGYGNPHGHEEVYLERYRTHNAEVLKYFENRPEDLLVVNWENGDKWDGLCAFLGEPIPDIDFPHANKGRY